MIFVQVIPRFQLKFQDNVFNSQREVLAKVHNVCQSYAKQQLMRALIDLFKSSVCPL